ncbi:hypothetical protein C8A03DRAFT_39585, partial [Achaetomium macrosporum]
MEQSAHNTIRHNAQDDSDTQSAGALDEFDAPDLEEAADEHLPGNARSLEASESSSSPLENLPAELRDQLLMNAPDLATLRSLVHASPVMHAQYRSNRDRLLRACLHRELDGFFVDAYACVMSRVRALGPLRTDETITAFLDSYRGWLSYSAPSAPPGLVESVDPGYVRWMAA